MYGEFSGCGDIFDEPLKKISPFFLGVDTSSFLKTLQKNGGEGGEKQRHHHRPHSKVCSFGRRQKDDGFFLLFDETRSKKKKKKKKRRRRRELRHIIIIFTNALFKKKKHTLCVCVGVLVGVGVSGVVVVRKQRGNTGAAFREEEEEEEEEEACVTFFLFGGDAQIPKGTPLSLWGKKMTTDRKYVRARGGGGLEHRFSFICVVVDVSRRGSAPTVSVLRVSFPRFFVFPRDAFLRGRESAIASESGCRQFSLSLSLFLSLTERALPKRRPNGFDD